jgi:hypothetical protein
MRRSLALLLTLAGCSGAGTSVGSAPHAVASDGGVERHAPSLAAAPGWRIRTVAVGGIATAEASTAPLRDPPGNFPSATLRDMPARGIVIFASRYLGAGSRHVPAPRSMPYKLSIFRHDQGWEGQPAANVPQYVLFTSLHRHLLDVRVFFGTQHPSRHEVTRAQAELDTLSWG